MERQRLYWVDTGEPALHAYDPVTGHDQAWAMPSWIGCAVLSEHGEMVALRTGLYDFHEDNGALFQIGAPPFRSAPLHLH